MRVVCPLCNADTSRYERVVNGFRLERCDACGHVFMNPQYSADEITQLYTNRNAEDLVALYRRIGAAESVKAEYHKRLETLERILPGRGRLLDFACGAGYFFELAQRRGWDAHGTELGAWATQAAAARGLANLHIGNLADIAFPDQFFDVVYAVQVFEHLPRPTVDLAEIRRILRPGGLLYLDVPNYQMLSILVGRDDFLLNEPPQHVNYFTPKTLAGLVQSCAFSDIHVRTGGGLKWETILGRRYRSDVTEAYGLQSDPDQSFASNPATNQPQPSLVKRLLLAALVRPLLYDSLKVGMNLTALARRPSR
jgi:SAM-dependent methyltransferase